MKSKYDVGANLDFDLCVFPITPNQKTLLVMWIVNSVIVIVLILVIVDGVCYWLIFSLHVVFVVSSHRCRFSTSSQLREGRKIPKKGLSLFFQVILGGVCPPLPLLCTHTNTQTCKHMASADLSTISHGSAGTGSCFRSWLTHMQEAGKRVIEMSSTFPWEQNPSIRRKWEEWDRDTERSRHVFPACWRGCSIPWTFSVSLVLCFLAVPLVLFVSSHIPQYEHTSSDYLWLH